MSEYPSHWRVAPFRDLVTLRRGVDLPVQDREGGEIPIFGSNGIVGSHSRATQEHPGIVTGRSGSIGNVYLIRTPFWALNTTLYSELTHGNNIEYIFHFLKWFDLSRFSGGTGVPTLNRNDVHDQPIGIPPLPEQRKIAEILSGIDQVIVALEKQEAKNLDLALSIAQGVFETNRESMRLGDLSTLITKGTTPTSLGMSFSEQGINFIKVESIVKDGILDPSKFSFVSPDVHAALKRSQIQSDDILFTIAGATVGKIALAQEHLLPANTNQALAIIRVNREVLRPQFAYFWLKSRTIKGIVERHQTVGAQPNVSLSQIGDFPVPPISLEMQDGICRRLDSIDQMLHSIGKKILRLKYLRQSLSSDLLSGRKRVSV